MQLFKINKHTKKLEKIYSAALESRGFTEPYDLETWIVSNEKEIFEKSILWIARQDYVTSEQRSDLIGVDETGSLIICELKRGMLSKSVILQALGYASEYSRYDITTLSEKLLKNVLKGNMQYLPGKINVIEDAIRIINEHLTAGKGVEEVEINESQTIILVGEDFTPTTLSIVEYLNNSSESLSFLIECWKYILFPISDDEYQLAFEQILPPPSIIKQIAEKREEIKSRKYARDPKRVKFMYWLVNELWRDTDFKVYRKPGASYYCVIAHKSAEDIQFEFNVYHECPRLILPKYISTKKVLIPDNVKLNDTDPEKISIDFVNLRMSEIKPDVGFLNNIKTLIIQLIDNREDISGSNN